MWQRVRASQADCAQASIRVILSHHRDGAKKWRTARPATAHVLLGWMRLPQTRGRREPCAADQHHHGRVRRHLRRPSRLRTENSLTYKESYLYDSMWDRQGRRVRCISPYSHDCRSWEASILAPQSSPFIAFNKRGEASNPLNDSSRRNGPEAQLSRLVKGREAAARARMRGRRRARAGAVRVRACACCCTVVRRANWRQPSSQLYPHPPAGCWCSREGRGQRRRTHRDLRWPASRRRVAPGWVWV